MKILHTSDWHIGRSLYNRKRYEEFEAFLEWLLHLIEDEKVDILLVAGDIFDTSAPSNKSQQLYYDFLRKASLSRCRHIIVIAGNHDSPTFLDAPKDLLKALNVHVIGTPSQNPKDEVLALRDPEDRIELIVCAVPYLRDRDLRKVESGESIQDKDAKLTAGLAEHYRLAAEEAKKVQQETVSRQMVPGGLKAAAPPIIAMGHLFTAGGMRMEGDGVRELYVGSLAHVGKDIFPELFDYVALGHLHVPQKVGGSEIIRYSGSSIPMGFGEAGQKKTAVLIEFSEPQSRVPKISLKEIPRFQELLRIEGDMDNILETIHQAENRGSSAWLEVEYTGSHIVGNLRERLEEAVEGTNMEILRVRNRRITNHVLKSMDTAENLEDLKAEEMFIRCLDQYEVPDEQRFELVGAYREILKTVFEKDGSAD